MKPFSDLGPNEGDGPFVGAHEAAREEVAQVQPERLPVVEPPVERLALRVDAVTSTELD